MPVYDEEAQQAGFDLDTEWDATLADLEFYQNKVSKTQTDTTLEPFL